MTNTTIQNISTGALATGTATVIEVLNQLPNDELIKLLLQVGTFLAAIIKMILRYRKERKERLETQNKAK